MVFWKSNLSDSQSTASRPSTATSSSLVRQKIIQGLHSAASNGDLRQFISILVDFVCYRLRRTELEFRQRLNEHLDAMHQTYDAIPILTYAFLHFQHEQEWKDQILETLRSVIDLKNRRGLSMFHRVGSVFQLLCSCFT